MRTPAYARRNDPATSHDAAKSIHPTRLEAIVLAGIVACGWHGATSDELAAALNMPRVTISPRFRPLARKGLIKETHERRIGISGRASVVWKAS